MGIIVHAREVRGETVFRVWNTVVDQYETGVMSRSDALEYLTGNLKTFLIHHKEVPDEIRAFATDPKYAEVHEKFGSVLQSKYDHFPSEAERRLDQAAKNGTDYGSSVGLKSRWSRERKH